MDLKYEILNYPKIICKKNIFFGFLVFSGASTMTWNHAVWKWDFELNSRSEHLERFSDYTQMLLHLFLN